MRHGGLNADDGPCRLVGFWRRRERAGGRGEDEDGSSRADRSPGIAPLPRPRDEILGEGRLQLDRVFLWERGHYQARPSTYCAGLECDWRPVSWTVLCRPFGDNRRGTGFATANGRGKRLPRETPSTRGDLWGRGERGRGQEREGGTLDEYFLDILRPDLAGAILEHLVVLALGRDDGLAGGLALCRVEGVWRIHGVGRTVWETEGLLYAGEEGLGRRSR